jgi:hypothetical protein
VVVPCARQERFLPRTVAALERALEGRAWSGALVLAAPGGEPPALSPRWRVITPPVATRTPLTPGAARMLGFAACGGEWVLFVDADVEVEPAWVAEALAIVSGASAPDARLAGLWGRLEEWFEEGGRVRPGAPDLYRVGRAEREVDYLATLALYRREALAAAGGYDPRLHSEEDFELGLRLKRAGHRMRSLGRLAGRHWSAPRPSFAELSRRWRTGLCFGQGEVLRLYLGRPGFGALLRRQGLYLATLAMWAGGAVTLGAALALRDLRPALLWAALPAGVLALVAARKRSARLAALSLLTWTLNGFGLVLGLLGAGATADDPAREAAC